MKLLGYLVVTIGLVLGAIGASTAYLADLSLPDELLLPQERPASAVEGDALPPDADAVNWLQLAAPVWPEGDPDEVSVPLAAPGAALTPELLAELRGAGIESIRVKSFSFARWKGKWLTMLGALGLLVGAGLVRMSARAAHDAAASEAAASGAASAETLVDGARQAVIALAEEAGQTPVGEERTALIMKGAAEIQRSYINPLLEGRGRLRARLGLTRYARFMDRFAAAERQVNRAWSSSADMDSAEALACLHRASETLDEARQRLA